MKAVIQKAMVSKYKTTPINDIGKKIIPTFLNKPAFMT
jgi:hypothetical protein